jgi:high-affinity iron transporter
MLPSFLITLREGLEAALIVGIMLSMLGKMGREDGVRTVWLGVLAAAVVSLTAGIVLNVLGLAFEGRAEELFEGVMMLLAAGVLTWVIFWMARFGRDSQARLEDEIRQAARTGGQGPLFVLAFVAVVREGIETALFLTATVLSTSPGQALAGGLLGLAAAVAMGWLMFAAGKKLNVRVFFQVTGVILLLVAAGLVAHGIHELQEAAVLPTGIEHVWDINPILDEKGTAGLLLTALFGYNGNPSLIEAIAYAVYLAIVGGAAFSFLSGWQTRQSRSLRQ